MMQVPRGAALAGAPQLVEDGVRRAGGLATLRLLHPPGLREFSRQDRAIECLQALEVSGQYASAEIGQALSTAQVRHAAGQFLRGDSGRQALLAVF